MANFSLHGLRPVFLMLLVQFLSAGTIVVYKLASEYGMSLKVLIAYRFIMASVATAPFAYFIERKQRPKLTLKIILPAFAGSFFGGLCAQNLYVESVVFTSATIATAITNLIPGITFIMGILFRLENGGLNTLGGKGKVLGTLISIAGAMLLTMYNGPEVKIWSTRINLLHKTEQQDNTHHKPLLGSLLAVGSCFASASSMILRAKTSASYPCYSSTALICFCGAIQTTVYALCTEKDWSEWKLGWNFRLVASLYAGVVTSAIGTSISMYCVQIRGPLFVSIFSPLMLIIVAIASSIFLMETLTLGSVLGATIILTGLYIVVWGKSKERKQVNPVISSDGFEETKPGEGTTIETIDIETGDVNDVNPLGVGSDLIVPTIISSSDDENMEIICEQEAIARRSEDP